MLLICPFSLLIFDAGAMDQRDKLDTGLKAMGFIVSNNPQLACQAR